ncbi:hypothetical protein BFJ72_g13857 [Fusarium proliferatum]|uniref:Nucleoside phosphorylase domain-containing protein n=1 Tax=Gibberella intermedia TaxID=948311 RepID=A0A420SB91_GIBIN|nr:hypothetical protein BFJ72_g13857 [Fusarium proliferatum]
MLDVEHNRLPRHPDDSNSYILGTMQGHNVVMACSPASQYGKNSTASLLTSIMRTFPNVRIGLMVGIGGGVPTKVDMRLGDIVVGVRVMQCDLGKAVRSEAPRIPDSSIRTSISNIRSRHELTGSQVPSILKDKIGGYPAYDRPGEADILFRSSYNHSPISSTCGGCDKSQLEERKLRVSTDPAIYYGGIASVNCMMRDAVSRDKIAQELDVICFEMEAAGTMDLMPYLVIRGISDYSDSHRYKEWQRYASATAAAYAYEFLEVWGEDSQATEVDYLHNFREGHLLEIASRVNEPSAQYQTNSISTAAASALPLEDYARRSRYKVGIICALPKELMAVRALFDETHPRLKKNKDDTNTYALGKMGLHHVVATCLAEYGTNSAALVAVHMKRSFKIRFCLLVGIGGGVPSAQHDIRLGDVVVGKYTVQYDLGRETEDEGFQRRNQPLQTPPLFLKTAFKSLYSDPDLPMNPLDPYLHTISSKERMSHYCYPGSHLDIMFNSCSKCSSLPEPCQQTRRCERRKDPIPKIHYGGIASGNSVIANATLRDQKAAELDVACFEMEAAGIVDAVSCLVIRGICDYCDGHKNDDWQEYAAATAASFAKLLLGVVDEQDGDDDILDGNYGPPPALKRRLEETQ